MKSWLHISDLHFGNGQAISNRMRKAFLDYLKVKKPNVEFLFITGDLIFAPKANDSNWEEAVIYVEKMQNLLNIKKENTFLVPGNHDVKRDDVREALVSKLISTYDSHDGVISESILSGLDSSYSKFKEAYFNICGREYNKHHFVAYNKDINIVLIDTALTYSEENQDRKLILGTELIDQALNDIDNSKPGIVLAHHSFECMADSERIVLETALKDSNILLYLCGHEHKALFKDIRTINQQKHLYEYLCGSDMDRGPNRIITDMDFFIGHLMDDGKTGFIEALKFSRDNRKFLPDIEFSSRQDANQQNGKHFFSKTN